MLRLSKSCIGANEKQAVLRVLNNEYLGMGAEVERFEQALADFFGREVVCVCNGTAALQLALQGVNVGAGAEVLVQSLTYLASFQSISATGAKPVACDINPETLTINLDDAERRLTEKTKAIMPVHYAGGAVGLDSVYDFAERHRLRVVEDAAHAFGSAYCGKKVGAIGDVSCFSFDGIKNITSGEGGCIVSDDAELLAKVRDARLLGVKNDTISRFQGRRSWDFDVDGQGWRYHMSDVMAAIGLEQLNRFPEFSEKRRGLARLYDKLLEDVHFLTPLKHDYSEVVPHIYVVKVGASHDRDKLRSQLENQNIQTGIHYKPNHQLSYYRDMTIDFPVTEREYLRLLTLPLHPDLSEDDVHMICSVLKLLE